MSCQRRRCGGGNSWSYSWSTGGNGVTYYTYNTGSTPVQYVQPSTNSSSGTANSANSGKPSKGHPPQDKANFCKDYYEYGLYLHNWYRRRHGSPNMTLVDRLNKSGDAYAYKLACQRTLYHSSGLDYNENLYMSYDTSLSKKEHVRMACKMWYDEKKLYNYSSPGFSMQTGHFTAMLWKGSTQLGIGVGVANGCVVVAGCYKPHANMTGEFTKNVLPWRDVDDTDDEEEKKVEKKKSEEVKKTTEEKVPEKTITKENAKKEVEESSSSDSESSDDSDEEFSILEGAKKAFEQKADADSTIGWSELKDLLNENVRVAFKFEGFDKTICTLLISLMTVQKQEKPRITVEEFGDCLQCFEGFIEAYSECDKDNSGALDPFEFKSALEDAGFNIGYKTFQILQKMFAGEDGDMMFRGFAICFLLLAKLQIVQKKRPAFEDFSMKDWLQQEIESIGPE